MGRPAHFRNHGHFSRYVLQCAIRDRETYLESIVSPYRYGGEYDDNTRQYVEDTKMELREMRARLARLTDTRQNLPQGRGGG